MAYVPQDNTPPANVGCAYQVEINYHEYQCMTAQEYSAYKHPTTAAPDIHIGGFLLAYGLVCLVLLTAYGLFRFVQRRVHD